MRRLVMISCVFLTLSGGWLTTASEFLKVERSTTVAVLHIWAGFFFLVIEQHTNICVRVCAVAARALTLIHGSFALRVCDQHE